MENRIKKLFNKNKIAIIGITAIFVFVICLFLIDNSKTVSTSASITNLSNKKIEWGIKRNDNHEQPDLGSVNKRIIDEQNGIAMGNKEYKKVYLTFDNGYEAGYTQKILDTLKNNNVTATFFITAHYVNTSGDLVKSMIDNGNIIGNHTVNHYSMPQIDNEKLKKEIMDLHTAVYEKFGYEMKYIRPPKGEYNKRTLEFCNSLGYKTVMWSLAYDDWDENNQRGVDYAKAKILDNLHPGAVILLHGNSKDNANVLDTVIKEAKNMGYEFKNLDEFVF